MNGAFNKGWNYYSKGWKAGETIFIAALGMRDVVLSRATHDGLLWDYGIQILIWSSGPIGSSCSYYFNASTVYQAPQGYYGKSLGCPIYPVVE